MWISKKKLNQMMVDAVEREKEKDMLYRFMEDTHSMYRKMDERVIELEHIVQNLPNAKKRQLNG